MSDNFNTSYLATRKARQQPQMDAMLAELDALAQAPQASPAAAPASPAPAKKESSPGYISEALKAVGGGAVDAVRNAWNTIDDAATWLDNNFIDLRMGSSSFGRIGGAEEAHKESLQVPALPEWAQNKTVGGNIGRSLTQFVVPFLGATKALRTAGVASKAVSGMGAGAATDFAAFDPHEKRLSNLIMEFSDGNPALGKPIFEYLQADPNDSNMMGRAKNAIEGLGLGLATEGLLKGLGAVKAHYTAKGQNAAEAIQEAGKATEDLAEHAIDTAKAPDMSLANQIDLITGVRNDPSRQRWQKRLDVQAAVKDADTPKSSLQLTDEPLQAAAKESNPDAFLKGNREMRLEDPNAVPFEAPAKESPAISIPEQWKLIEEEQAAGKLRSAYWDPAESDIIFTREKPTPGALPLDQRVEMLTGKAPFELTAEDKVLLRAYKQLQESAVQTILKPGDEAAAVARSGDSIITDISAGTGNSIWSDRQRTLARNGTWTRPKKAPSEAPTGPSADLNATPLDDRIAAAQARVDALMEAGEDTTTAQKVLDGLLRKKDADLFDHSSKLSAKEANHLDTEADSLVDSIAANDEKLSKALGKQQGGFISPSMLANMVAAQGGAATGFLSADEDASVAERLSLAGVGALAGLGLKVGATKVLKGHERDFLKNVPPEVASMARPEVAGVAPVVATAKKAPVIHAAQVNKLVEAAKSGGMEALAKAVKESDFNFSRIDSADDVKQTIDAFSEVFEKETSLAKHGTQSFDDMKELANELGAGVGSLKELYKGTNNLGARILAHRALLTASAEKVTDLSKLALGGDADAILALRKQVALHASIQAQMKGVQTEVARALSQFRITSSSIDLAVNERNQLIDALGGHAANIKFAKQLSEITNPAQLGAVVRKSSFARTQDALFEAWVNGLLSGPATHVVNALGNGIVAVGSSAERLTASMWGKVLRTGSDAVTSGEAKAHLFGMMEGVKSALGITKAGLDSLKQAAGEAITGDFGAAKETIQAAGDEFGGAYKAFAADAPVLDNAAFGTKEMPLQKAAIGAEQFNLNPSSAMGYLADGLGALIRTPGRLLTTSDEIFKTIHYRGELTAQAYRTAVAEGREGETLIRRVAELVEDPTPELSAQALTAAREGTFSAPLGEAGASLQRAVMAVPGARYVMPFMRTPANIMKYIGERTPGLNLLASGVRAEFAAGGARRDMMLAKTTMGGSLYALGGYLASQGYIVGGGEKNQSAEKLGGAQPYSLKVGDTYYAFNRTDPVGMFLGIAADMADIGGHLDESSADEIASAAVLAISRNLTSKSYASGLINLIEAISNPDQKGQKYLNSLVGSIVPSAVNSVRKEEDPVVREVWTMVDAFKNRIPGYSTDLPPALNVFGEEVKYRGGLGPDIASPISTSEATTDRAASEIARLNIDLKHPPRTIGAKDGGPGIDLSHEQYYRLVKLMGSEVGEGGFKGAMLKLLDDPSYKALPETDTGPYMGSKEKIIRNLFDTHKRAATVRLMEEFPELKAQFIQNRTNGANALTGKPILPF